MMRTRFLLFLLTTCIFFSHAFAADPLLKPGDRVAILGGTFVERMQSAGSLEAELQCRRPDWKLSFRNLGWSGDDVHGIARKRFDGPEDGYQRILADVATADPTVVLVAYGFSESSDGDAAVDRFESGLRRLIGDLSTKKRRVILVAPVAMPGYRMPGYAEATDRCRKIVVNVGAQSSAPALMIDWHPAKDEVTSGGLVPNEKGYARFADAIAGQLVGGEDCDARKETLKKLIVKKNQLFFYRYRPENETYLLLFRKHEQGNNAAELPLFDPLVGAADEAIWEAATRAK